jgi:hypothetical protein
MSTVTVPSEVSEEFPPRGRQASSRSRYYFNANRGGDAERGPGVNIESGPLADLIGKLEGEGCNPRRRGDQWSALCPAHNDKEPSLSLREGDDGRALVKCHAGCTPEAVVAALGLSMAALFPSELRETLQEVREEWSAPEKTERKFGPDDVTFGAVPACIIMHACQMCLRVYAYVAFRSGKQNIPQRGVRAIARAIRCDPRTASLHLEYLAATGWLFYEAKTTTTGAHRNTKVWLRNCPALDIVNPDAVTPSSTHHERTVMQPMHHSSDSVTATDAPPSEQPMHHPAITVVQPMHHSLGTRYEQVGLGGEEEVTDLTVEYLDELLENQPEDDAPPPTDIDVVNGWELAEEPEPNSTVALLLAAFPGSEVVTAEPSAPGNFSASCAGCARPVVPSPTATAQGWDTLCADCYEAEVTP